MSWELATAFTGFALLWLFLEGARMLDDREHGIIKLFLYLLSFWFSFYLVRINLAIVTENALSSDVTGAVTSLVYVLGAVCLLITFYFLIYYLYQWFNKALDTEMNTKNVKKKY